MQPLAVYLSDMAAEDSGKHEKIKRKHQTDAT